MSPTRLLVRTPPTTDLRYSLLLTRDAEHVRAAQRLRYRVFADELGARLRTPRPGLDVDAFDEHCDHLVVLEDHTSEVVGTYRMLPPAGARRAGSLYCDGEFDASALDPLRRDLVETGRSCVHPDHRSGAVVSLVWAGIARYLVVTGRRWLVGCASVPLRTPGQPEGAFAAGVWDVVAARHLAPAEHRVRPLRPWDTAAAPRPHRPVLPPLLRGYLRLGAQVCGPPAHDPDFGVADLLVLLNVEQVDARYLRRFLGTGA